MKCWVCYFFFPIHVCFSQLWLLLAVSWLVLHLLSCLHPTLLLHGPALPHTAQRKIKAFNSPFTCSISPGDFCFQAAKWQGNSSEMLPYATFGHRFFLSEVKWLPVWLSWTATAPHLILCFLLSSPFPSISSPPLNMLSLQQSCCCCCLAFISAAPFLTCSAQKLAHPPHLLPPCLCSASSGEVCSDFLHYKFLLFPFLHSMLSQPCWFSACLLFCHGFLLLFLVVL